MPISKLLRLGPLAKNTLVLTGGMGTRALILAVLFLLMSRTLGVEQYGKFAAILAFISFFYPFVGLGAGVLLTRDTFCTPEDPRRIWGRTLLIVITTSLPLGIAAILLSSFIAPSNTSLTLIMSLVVAELMLMPIIQMGSSLYQAREKAVITSSFLAGIVLFRLCAFLLLLIFSTTPDAETWGTYYLVSTLFFTLLVLTFIWKDLGTPIWNMPNLRSAFRDGFAYSVMQASEKMSTDVDKVMLSRMDSLATTGLYAAGYRIMELLFLPLSALLWTSIGRFFKSGGKGAASTLRYGIRFLPLPFLYISICLASVYLGASYLPIILGSEYTGIDSVVLLLTLLMAVFFIRHLLRLIIIGTRSSLSAAVTGMLGAAINITANLFLIPAYSWKGAIVATFISELSMMALLSIILAYSIYNEKSNANANH